MKTIDDVIDLVQMKIIDYEDMEEYGSSTEPAEAVYLRRVRFALGVLRGVVEELNRIDPQASDALEQGLQLVRTKITVALVTEPVLASVISLVENDPGDVRAWLWRDLNAGGFSELPPDDIVPSEIRAAVAAKALRRLPPRRSTP